MISWLQAVCSLGFQCLALFVHSYCFQQSVLQLGSLVPFYRRHKGAAEWEPTKLIVLDHQTVLVPQSSGGKMTGMDQPINFICLIIGCCFVGSRVIPRQQRPQVLTNVILFSVVFCKLLKLCIRYSVQMGWGQSDLLWTCDSCCLNLSIRNWVFSFAKQEQR